MNSNQLNLFIYLIVLTGLMLGMQLSPWVSILNWTPQGIVQHEYWRLITAHFVHTNGWHLAMNLAALYLIGWIFRDQFAIKRFTALLLGLSLFISLLLPFTNLTSYVGLSGVLHGLFAYYCMQEIIAKRKTSWFLLLGLVAKISMEQIQGGSALSQSLIQAQVAVDAHLFGVIGAVLCAFVHWLIKTRSKHSSNVSK